MNESKRILFIGILMGMADSVPGISGGTVAFVSGIYDTLIRSLSRFDLHAWTLLRKKQFATFFAYIESGFLIRLGIGICVSLITMAHIINYLLTHHGLIIWSLFLGMVSASAWVISQQMHSWNLWRWALLGAGFIIAWLAGAHINLSVEPAWFNFFLGGCIAISAMLLPGISGSFILLLLGLYQPVLLAVKNFDLNILLIFITGCITGLLLFSKCIHWLLQHYRMATQAFLLGLTLGALQKLWPWQVRIDEETEQYSAHLIHVLPGKFEVLTGESAQILLVCSLFIAGFAAVLLMQYADKKDKKEPA